MNNEQLLELGDLNLLELDREQARWHPDGEVCERGGWLMTAGGSSFAACNQLSRTRSSPSLSADEAIAAAKRFYNERRRSFSIRIRAHADDDLESTCQSLGLQRISHSPGMVLEAPIAEEPLPEGLELSVVRDVTGVEAYAEIVAESYATLGMPAEVGRSLFAAPEQLLAPHLHLVVAKLRGVPVSAAMLLLSHGIAGVYWVGTIPEGRGQGAARHVTRAVSNEAFEAGVPCVVLQASQQGEPIYKALGYREVTRYPWYVCSSR